MCQVAFAEPVAVAALLKAKAPEWRPGTRSEVTRHLRVDWAPLPHHAATEITRSHVASQMVSFAKRGSPVANRARASLSAFYKWAIGAGWAAHLKVIVAQATRANVTTLRKG